MSKQNAIEARLQTHKAINSAAKAVTANPVSDPAGAGVSIAWLAQCFDLDVRTVKQRLRHCPARTRTQRGKDIVTLYDIKEASRYLVTPAFATSEYLRAVKRGDLHPALQQTIWDALLKRQKWEENAGDLWRTAKVREVLRLVFQNMKFTIQLWAATVEQQTELSRAQRDLIVEMADNLQAELYSKLVSELDGQATPSQLAEMDELVGERDVVSDLMSRVESEDDEIEHLI